MPKYTAMLNKVMLSKGSRWGGEAKEGGGGGRGRATASGEGGGRADGEGGGRGSEQH